jgi:hypothetical protein
MTCICWTWVRLIKVDVLCADDTPVDQMREVNPQLDSPWAVQYIWGRGSGYKAGG